MIGIHSQTADAGTASFWLNQLPSSSLITINNQSQAGHRGEVKPPQGLRSRPASAGPGSVQVIRRFSKESAKSNLSSKMNVLAKGVPTNGTASAISMEQNQIGSDTYRLV